MSDSMLGEDPQETARALTTALQDMTKQLAGVKTTVRRGKWVIAALVVCLIAIVALTIGVSITAVQASDASGKASGTVTQLHASNVSACRKANVNRFEDVAIWNKFLSDLAPASARTRKVRAELAGINRLIRIKDKPRNCVATYKLRAALGEKLP